MGSLSTPHYSLMVKNFKDNYLSVYYTKHKYRKPEDFDSLKLKQIIMFEDKPAYEALIIQRKYGERIMSLHTYWDIKAMFNMDIIIAICEGIDEIVYQWDIEEGRRNDED